jgi:FkbM family methyltransferase
MTKLNQLYSQLSDVESRKLLAKLIAYRLLGLTKVQLRSATDTEMDRNFYANLQKLISVEIPSFRSGSFEVPCYDLRQIGINFQCYTIPFAINTEFRNQQYSSALVHVRPGDWVLDCGACWGDTSLWFAEQVTPSGRVFSFEFIPSSLEIFHANLALNPELSECIELVTHPVAESSGDIIRCQDNGAASTFKIAQMDDPNASFVEAVTVSIDDWVDGNNLQKVDFIKMDIEGAELDALRGAIETLKRFRPQLAIALYHRPEDIYEIPDFLVSQNLGYRYYLKHPTSAGFETVLLALCDLD